LQGTAVVLDGSLSTDDVGIVNFTWTFTDAAPVALWGPVVTFRFVALGNRTVTLTVHDLIGNSDSALTWVDVIPDPEPPVARAGSDQTITLGQPALLNGSQSTDNVGIVNYTWRADSTGETRYGVAVTFLPDAGGLWHYVLTVADASGLTSQDVVNVTVVVVDTTPPGAPLGSTARTGGPGEILLNWTPNGEPDLVGYLLYRSDLESGPFIRINTDPLANASYVDIGLVPGVRYWYIVRAVDRAGNPSAVSAPASALAGLPSPSPFDWNSLRWALVPLSVAASMLILALLARREGRRQRAGSTPPDEPGAPPAPPS
jgi:hypothetical protein